MRNKKLLMLLVLVGSAGQALFADYASNIISLTRKWTYLFDNYEHEITGQFKIVDTITYDDHDTVWYRPGGKLQIDFVRTGDDVPKLLSRYHVYRPGSNNDSEYSGNDYVSYKEFALDVETKVYIGLKFDGDTKIDLSRKLAPDSTAPEFSLSSSISLVDGKAVYTAKATNVIDVGSGLRSITFRFNNQSSVRPVSASSEASWILPVPLGVENSYDLTVIAEDQLGWKTTKTLTVSVDTRAPAVSFRSTPDDWTNGSVQVTATAIDARSAIDTTSWEHQIGGTTGAWESGNSATVYTNSVIYWRVKDSLGNQTGAIPYSVTKVDKQIPNVFLSTPKPWVNTATVGVAVEVSDEESGANYSSWIWESGESGTAGISGAATLAIPKIAGLHNLTFVGYDKAGNSKTAQLTVGYDSDADFSVDNGTVQYIDDTGKQLSSTELDVLYKTPRRYASLRLSLSHSSNSDNAPLESYSVFENGGTVIGVTAFTSEQQTSGTYSVDLSALFAEGSRLSTGSHKLTIKVADVAGNSRELTLNLNLDYESDPLPELSDFSVDNLLIGTSALASLRLSNDFLTRLATGTVVELLDSSGVFASLNRDVLRTTEVIANGQTTTFRMRDAAGNLSAEKTLKVVWPKLDVLSLTKVPNEDSSSFILSVGLPLGAKWEKLPEDTGSTFRYVRRIDRDPDDPNKPEQLIDNSVPIAATALADKSSGSVQVVEHLEIFAGAPESYKDQILGSDGTIYVSVASAKTNLNYQNLSPVLRTSPVSPQENLFLGPNAFITPPTVHDPEGDEDLTRHLDLRIAGETIKTLSFSTEVTPLALSGFGDDLSKLAQDNASLVFVYSDLAEGVREVTLGELGYELFYDSVKPSIASIGWTEPSNIPADRYSQSAVKPVSSPMIRIEATDDVGGSGIESVVLTMTKTDVTFPSSTSQSWPLKNWTGFQEVKLADEFGTLNGTYHFTVTAVDKSKNSTTTETKTDKVFDQTPPQVTLSAGTSPRIMPANGLVTLGTVSDPLSGETRSGVEEYGVSTDSGKTWVWQDGTEYGAILLNWSERTVATTLPVMIRAIDWAGNETTIDGGTVRFDPVEPAFTLKVDGLNKSWTGRRVLSDLSAFVPQISESRSPAQTGISSVFTLERLDAPDTWTSVTSSPNALELRNVSWTTASRYRVSVAVSNFSGRTQDLVSDEFVFDSTAPSAITAALATSQGGTSVSAGEPFDVTFSGGTSSTSPFDRVLVVSQLVKGTFVEDHRLKLSNGVARVRTAISTQGAWQVQVVSTGESGLTSTSSAIQLSVSAPSWSVSVPEFVAPGQVISVKWNGPAYDEPYSAQIQLVDANSSGGGSLATASGTGYGAEIAIPAGLSAQQVAVLLILSDSSHQVLATLRSLPSVVDFGSLDITTLTVPSANSGVSLPLTYKLTSSTSGVSEVSATLEKKVGSDWVAAGTAKSLAATAGLSTVLDLAGLGLPQGSPVRVRLLATDGTQRRWEALSTTTVVDSTPPPVPMLEILEQAVPHTGTVHLSWGLSQSDQDSGITRFEWGWYTVGTRSEPSLWAVVEPDTLEVWQSGLVGEIQPVNVASGQTIAVVVRAVNGAGLTTTSSPLLVVVDDDAPTLGVIQVLSPTGQQLVGWLESSATVGTLEVKALDQTSRIASVVGLLTMNDVNLEAGSGSMTADSNSLYSRPLEPAVTLEASTSATTRTYRARVLARDIAGNEFRASSFSIQLASPIGGVRFLTASLDRQTASLSWQAPEGDLNALIGYQVVATIYAGNGSLKSSAVRYKTSTVTTDSFTWGSEVGADLQATDGDTVKFAVQGVSRTGHLFPKTDVPEIAAGIELTPPTLAQLEVPVGSGGSFVGTQLTSSVAFRARHVSELKWRVVDAETLTELVGWTRVLGKEQVLIKQTSPEFTQGRQLVVETAAANSMGIWSQVFSSPPVVVDLSSPEVVKAWRANPYSNDVTRLSGVKVEFKDGTSGIYGYRLQLVPAEQSIDDLPVDSFGPLSAASWVGKTGVYSSSGSTIDYTATGSPTMPEGKYKVAVLVANGTGTWTKTLAVDDNGNPSTIWVDRTAPSISSLNIDDSARVPDSLGVGTYVFNSIDARATTLQFNEPVSISTSWDAGLDVVLASDPVDQSTVDGTGYTIRQSGDLSIDVEPLSPKRYSVSLALVDRAGNSSTAELGVRFNFAPEATPTVVDDTTPGRSVSLDQFVSASDPEWDFPMAIEWSPSPGAPILKWVSNNEGGRFFGDGPMTTFVQSEPKAQESTYRNAVKITDRWGKSSVYSFDVTVHNTLSGSLFADEYWGDSVVLAGTVVVPVGRTLTVAKGTSVRLPSAGDIVVDGTLLTLGNSSFGSADGSFWGSIRIRGSADVLETDLSGADRAITILPGGSLVLKGASIHRNRTGIHVLGSGKALVDTVTVFDNQVYGIKEDLEGRPTLTNSRLYRNLVDYYSWSSGPITLDEINRLAGNAKNRGE